MASERNPSVEFFNLTHPALNDRFMANKLLYSSRIAMEIVRCPVNKEHWIFSRRCYEESWNATLNTEVRHNQRLDFLWVQVGEGPLVHERVVQGMDSLGFTGYRWSAATVRFRDGEVSDAYRRLDVIGWGGIARPESGIRLLEECPGCPIKKYSPLRDPAQLIDRDQWTGDDFFLVWPVTSYLFITARVSEYLQSINANGHIIQPLQGRLRRSEGKWDIP